MDKTILKTSSTKKYSATRKIFSLFIVIFAALHWSLVFASPQASNITLSSNEGDVVVSFTLSNLSGSETAGIDAYLSHSSTTLLGSGADYSFQENSKITRTSLTSGTYTIEWSSDNADKYIQNGLLFTIRLDVFDENGTPEKFYATAIEYEGKTPALIVSNLEVILDDFGQLTGRFDIDHPLGQVTNLRAHYDNFPNFVAAPFTNILEDADKPIDYEDIVETGRYYFQINYSPYLDETLYIKIEASSPYGVKLPTTQTSIDIPSSDTEPSQTGFEENTKVIAGNLELDFNVSHGSGYVKNLRVHYDSSGDFRNNHFYDFGPYDERQETGNKTASIELENLANNNLYVKLEVASQGGIKLDPPIKFIAFNEVPQISIEDLDISGSNLSVKTTLYDDSIIERHSFAILNSNNERLDIRDYVTVLTPSNTTYNSSSSTWGFAPQNEIREELEVQWSLELSDLPAGQYKIEFFARDNEGKVGSTSAYEFILEHAAGLQITSPPSIVSSTLLVSTSATSTSDIERISFSLNTPDGSVIDSQSLLSVSNPSGVTYNSDSNAFTWGFSPNQSTRNINTNWEVDISQLDDANYALRFFVKDNFGVIQSELFPFNKNSLSISTSGQILVSDKQVDSTTVVNSLETVERISFAIYDHNKNKLDTANTVSVIFPENVTFNSDPAALTWGFQPETDERNITTNWQLNLNGLEHGQYYIKFFVKSGEIKETDFQAFALSEVPNNADAPLVNHLNGYVNRSQFSEKVFKGNFTVFHETDAITNLRVHYDNNTNFTNGYFIDIGTGYSDTHNSGRYRFSIGLGGFSGDTLFVKVEAASMDGAKDASPDIFSVDISDNTKNAPSPGGLPSFSPHIANSGDTVEFKCTWKDDDSSIGSIDVGAVFGKLSEKTRDAIALDYVIGDLEDGAEFKGSLTLISAGRYNAYCLANDETSDWIYSPITGINVIGGPDDASPEIEITTPFSNNDNTLALSTLVTDDIQIDRVSFKVFDENHDPIDTSTSINVELGGDQQLGAEYNFDAYTWGTNPLGVTANTDWHIDVSGLASGKYHLLFFANDGVNTTEIEDFLEFEVTGEPTNIPQVSGLTANLDDELLSLNFNVSQSDGLVTGLRLHYSEFEDFRIESFSDIGGNYDEQQETGAKSVSVDVAEFSGRTLYYKIEVYNTEGEQLTPAPSGSIDIPGEIIYANITVNNPNDGVIYSLPGTLLHCGSLDDKCFTKIPVSGRLIIQANAAPGYEFDSWSISDQSAIEACNSNACSLQPTQDIIVEAQFTESQNTTPRIVDFFPRQMKVNEETKVTIISENVTDALVINIEGTIGHCEAIDFSGSNSEEYHCTANSEGNKRLYVKASAGDDSFVPGSEYLYLDVIPASSGAPVVWLENIPAFVELNTPLHLNVKVYDGDSDLVSLQVDWESDDILDSKVLLQSEEKSYRVPFSYTRGNNDTSPLKIRFIATDLADNETTINLQLPVIELAEGAIGSTGYLYAQRMFEEHLECEVPASTSPEVEPATGARVHSIPLLSVNGLLPIDVAISYHSLSNAESILGMGWTIENGMVARIHDDPERNVTVQWSESSFHKFEKQPEGVYLPRNKACRQERLTTNDIGGYTVEKLDRRKYIFGEFRTLERIENHLGQGLDLEYDGLGRLHSISDAVTNSFITFHYNNEGLIGSIRTKKGREVSFVYDSEKRLTNITHADGTEERFTYHSSGQIHERSLNGIKVSTTQYDELGRVSSLDDALSSNEVIRFRYEKSGTNLMVRQNDRNGHELLQEFDDKKLLVREVDQLGQEVIYEYNDRGLVETTTEKDGGKTQFEYNEFGDITKETLPNQAYNEYFYENRNLVSERNLRGHTRNLQYDGNNRLISETDFRGNRTIYDEYNERAQLLKSTSPEGRELFYSYENGRLKTETRHYPSTTGDPDSDETITKSFGFDVDGFPTVETDFEGNETNYEYDGRGRQTSITHPNQTSETWEYDAWGNRAVYLSQKRNAALLEDEDTNEGLEKKWLHNANGDLTDIEEHHDGEVSATRFELDGEGRILKETNPVGGVTTYIRDALGQITTEVSPTGDITTRTYSPMGKVVSRTDPRGNTTSFTYTPLYEIDEQTNALGEVTGFGYNSAGQQTSKAADAELQWTHRFNEEGNVEKVTFADESTNAEVEFDDDNYFTKLERPSDLTREVTPNVMGSPLKEDTSDDISLSWDYDGNQNPTLITNGRGQKTSFTYNTLALPDSREDVEERFEMDYDEDLNLISLTSDSGDIGLQYDGKGRLTKFSNTVEAEYAVDYIHDANDNIVAYGTRFDGVLLNKYAYVYDDSNRVTNVVADGFEDHVARIQRDDVGNISQITRSNGLIETFTYDALNRVSSYSLKNASEPILLSIAYKYNKLGQVVSESRTPVVIPPRELLASEISAYANNGQIEKVGQRTVAFDLDGNTSQFGDDSFTYDSRNRLINTQLYDLRYNGLDYRLSRYDSGSQQTTYFAVAPDLFGMDQTLLQSTNGNIVEFVQSPEGVLAEYHHDTQEFYHLHYDYRGSVIAVSNSSGQIVATFGYLPYGKKFAVEGDFETPIGWQGRYGAHTEPNGLVFLRSRHYSPELRRFLSKDEVRGDITNYASLNRYAYAGGDPINFVDPSGNIPFLPFVYFAGQQATGILFEETTGYPAPTLTGSYRTVIKLASKKFAKNQRGNIINSSNVALQAFSEASKYGIQTYKSLRKLIKGTGFEAHHLIEKRFASILGVKAKEMASIVLTIAEHRRFTNAWRKAIPYGSRVSEADILNAAKQIYKSYPAILKALGL